MVSGLSWILGHSAGSQNCMLIQETLCIRVLELGLKTQKSHGQFCSLKASSNLYYFKVAEQPSLMLRSVSYHPCINDWERWVRSIDLIQNKHIHVRKRYLIECIGKKKESANEFLYQQEWFKAVKAWHLLSYWKCIRELQAQTLSVWAYSVSAQVYFSLSL